MCSTSVRAGLIGLVLLSVAMLPGYAAAQAITGTDSGLGGINTITGMVLSPAGTRMERRIAVRLMTMTKGERIAFTDDVGNFGFRGVPSGEYMLIVDKEKEYETFTHSLTVVQPRGMPPQNFFVNIRLKAKPNTTPRASVVNADLAGVPKEAVELFNKAAEMIKSGNRKGAVEELERLVKDHPTFMLAHNELGAQYMRLGQLAKADASLETALKLDPEAYAPLINRGIVLFMMKRYADAEPLLATAVKMKGDGAVGHYFLGQALANLGKFDQAEKELLLAISQGGSEMKEAHRLLAIIYSSRADHKRVIEELETYLRLAPNTSDADQLRAVISKSKTAMQIPKKP